MKHLALFILLTLFYVSSTTADVLAEEISDFTRIDEMQVLVRSRQLKIVQYQNDKDPLEKIFAAGTPLDKKSILKDIPKEDNKGEAYRITFNSGYIPTKGHIASEKKKHPGKKVKGSFLPGDPDNPLGFLKIYFSFSRIDPGISLGAHCTNKPNSVGTRCSEGCARLRDEDAIYIAKIILRQNGIDPIPIIDEARNDRRNSITIKLKDRPKVVYLNE